MHRSPKNIYILNLGISGMNMKKELNEQNTNKGGYIWDKQNKIWVASSAQRQVDEGFLSLVESLTNQYRSLTKLN